MSVQLTREQQAVVDDRGGRLLVSAAAGSGKTRVLVDRLFSRVLGEEKANVNDFLIITYTRAAAAELRGRIAQELAKRLAEHPGDRHLQRQLLLVYQADIKTMTMNGVFAMSAVTALTAQNTTGVTDILEATPEFLAAELDAVFTDIRPDAVKVGMVSSAGLIELIAAKLREYGARHVVVDPVMVATSGAKLLRDDAIGTLKAADRKSVV